MLQRFISYVDPALCMGCGVCVDKCAQGALALNRTPLKGQPLDICQLLTVNHTHDPH